MRPILILAAVMWALSPAVGLAQSNAEIAAAGKQYQARCISCHQPPDLNFGTDRAWLEHIKTTA